MKLPLVLIFLFTCGLYTANAQSNKIFLVSKANNYTTYKLHGYSFFGRVIWYNIKTESGTTYKGLVRFSDSSLLIKSNTLGYDSIYSIEYSKFNKATNGIVLSVNMAITAIGSALVFNSNLDTDNPLLTIGLALGVPGLVGTTSGIYEVSKPPIYILRDYHHVRTKKGSTLNRRPFSIS